MPKLQISVHASHCCCSSGFSRMKIRSAASVLVLCHRAEIESVRTSSQHRQARERERLQGIKEDEEMQDEAVPKQVSPFVVRVMRSGLLLPTDA